MKAKPFKLMGAEYVPCSVDAATHVELNMPGPLPFRILPIILHGSRRDHPQNPWTWNGDTEKPTLKPSILAWTGEVRCHTWINDGQAIFLSDCSHELAGKTVDLLDIDEQGTPTDHALEALRKERA